MAQIRFRDPLAAPGLTVQTAVVGSPPQAITYRGTRRTGILLLKRQHLPAAASVHCSEPRVAQGTYFISHKEPFQQTLLDSSSPKKKTPKLSRTEAVCFQVSTGWRPGASRSRSGP